MSRRIRIGTTGWSIPRAYLTAFPEGGSHLERYAARFDAAEINSSFYRPHRRSTYERWAASVPEGFRFSVKIPKIISHVQKLVDCGWQILSFADAVAGLREKLGAVLVQLPPSLIFDPGIADAFFTTLRASIDAPIVCEPRHASWFCDAAEDVLIAQRIARVATDPAKNPGAEHPGGWTGLRYFRLHGSPVVYRSAYGDDRLRGYASTIAAPDDDAPAWCIFDNTASMAATGDALALRERIDGAGR